MPLRPLAYGLTAAYGALDGAVQDADEHATPARTKNLSQRSTWLEGAGLAGGVLGQVMGVSPTLTDPLALGGAFALGRRAGHAVMENVRTVAPMHAALYTPDVPPRGDAIGGTGIPRTQGPSTLS